MQMTQEKGLLLIIATEKITTLSKAWTTCPAPRTTMLLMCFLTSCCQSHEGVSELLKPEQKKKKRNRQFAVQKKMFNL